MYSKSFNKILDLITRYITKKEETSVILVIGLVILSILISFYLFFLKTPTHPDFKNGLPKEVIESYKIYKNNLNK